MEARPVRHPSDQTLSDYGLGKLDAGAASDIDRHLDGCPTCRERVAGLTGDSFLDRFRGASPDQGRSISRDNAGATLSYRTGAGPGLARPAADTMPPGLADHPDYEVKKELGRGGMGVVYLAHNRLMGRDEVLKVMGRHIMERPGVLDRFLREIRAVARLRHPNIVTAYSAFRLGDSIVFAMEHVEGLDLSRMVKAKGTLPVAHACLFIHQAALGLQHAHDEGLIHRDIKPGNLMLARQGEKPVVKVLDFGLAKVTREEKVDATLTSQGQALGTPDYIAPEQILDATSADIRADIYSLGGTLFFLLTGRPPFKATSLYDLYQAHISRDADPLNFIRPEVPAELAALVAKMMAKDPNRRFQTPGDVAEALIPFFKRGAAARNFAADVSTSPTVQTPRGAPRRIETQVAPAIPPDTQPSTALTPPARPTRKDLERTDPESRWESLLDIEATEPSATPLPSPGTARKPPWIWPSVAAGVLLLGLLGASLSGVFKVNTPDGTIVVEGLPQDAEVFVDGGKVNLRWPGLDRPLEIKVEKGTHRLEVRKGGFKTFGESVTIEAGGAQKVTVSLEPQAEDAVADLASKPAETPKREGPNDQARAQDRPIPAETLISSMPPTPSGLRFLDIVAGTGLKPREGQTCVVHYTGWLWQDGRKGPMFDNSRDRGEPTTLDLRKTIRGWTEGVSGMNVGGKRLLLVPPSIAYGSKGAGTSIPPNATLLFEIELLSLSPSNETSSAPGSIPIFNGKDLSGWDGDRGLWSVRDGVIVGETNATRPLSANTCLIWKGGTPSNFTLRFKCKVTNGNTGVQVRSRVVDGDRFVVGGYQADIDTAGKFTGYLYDELGRGILAQRGERVTIASSGSRNVERLGNPNGTTGGGWNEYTVLCQGDRIAYTMNDITMSEVIDRETGKSTRSGVIALQLHLGPPMSVQFKDIEIKELDASVQTASTAAEPAQDLFRPGSVWIGLPGNTEFTVQERSGERFTALFKIGDQRREIHGTIRDGHISWLARDVRVLAGNPGGDNQGTIKGETAEMSWNWPGGPTQGIYTLKLKSRGRGAGR